MSETVAVDARPVLPWFRLVDGQAPCLLLWDIDYTLIANEGMSKEIYAAAFRRLTGREPKHLARTAGRTDPQIMAGMLLDHGLEPSDDYGRRMHEALAGAGREKASRLREKGRALPGAVDALRALGSTDGVAQSVLSGNILLNAVVKLAAFDLDGFLDFSVGGFGSDHELRSKLVGIAEARAHIKYGVPAEDWSTVLIGDTPRDVDAAKSGGARVVGVATGENSVAELEAAGADVVLTDLLDTERVRQTVLELASQTREASQRARLARI